MFLCCCCFCVELDCAVVCECVCLFDEKTKNYLAEYVFVESVIHIFLCACMSEAISSLVL